MTNGTTTFQLSPGEPFPAEGPDEVPGDDETGDGNGSGGGGGGGESGGGGSGLSAGAIAGIAIGGVAVLLIGVAMVYFCGRKGGIEKGYRRSRHASQAMPPNNMVEAQYADDGRQNQNRNTYQSQSHPYNPYDQPPSEGGGMPKSPPPGSTYTNSTYGGPPDAYARARSPNQLSEMGSPHNSYVHPGHPSPGHPSPGYPPAAFGSPHLNQ